MNFLITYMNFVDDVIKPEVIFENQCFCQRDIYHFFTDEQLITLYRTEQGIMGLTVEIATVDCHAYKIHFLGNNMRIESDKTLGRSDSLISDESINRYREIFNTMCDKIAYCKKIYEMFNSINENNEILLEGLWEWNKMNVWYQSYNYDKSKRKFQPSIKLYDYQAKLYDEYMFFIDEKRIFLQKTEQGIIALTAELTTINDYSYNAKFIGNRMCVEPSIAPNRKGFLISDENIEKYKEMFGEIGDKVSYYKKIYEAFNDINENNEILTWGL